MTGMELFQIYGRIALNGTDEVNSELTGVTSNAEGSSNKIVSAFKKIGTAVATYFAVDKIVAFGKACVGAAADVAAEQAAFTQIMGDYSDDAQTKIDEIADATGITSSRLTPYMTSISAKFKGLGYGVEDATDLAQRGLTLAADASAFWDKSIDESVAHLNSFINGSYQGGEAIGLFANDAQMATYAVEQGLIKDTKAWANLDEATKQATRLKYAENQMALSGATGQAAKEADAYLNVQGNLNEAWRQFQATIGNPILEKFVLPIMQKLADVVLPAATTAVETFMVWIGNAWQRCKEWWAFIAETFAPAFEALKVLWETVRMSIKMLIQPMIDWLTSAGTVNGLAYTLAVTLQWLSDRIVDVCMWLTHFVIWLSSGSDGAKALTAVILAGVAAVVAFKATMMALATYNAIVTFINTLKTAILGLNAALSANAIGIVIAALAALAAAVTYLWNNCESFRNFVIEMWETIKTSAIQFYNSIVQVIEDMKNAWATFQLWITMLWNNIKTTATNVWNSIKTFFTTTWNNIKTTATNVWNSIKTFFTTTWNSISTTATNVWNKITGFFTNTWNGISTTATTVTDAVKNAFTKAWNAVKSTTTTVWNAIKKAIETPINKAKDIVSKAIESIKGFFNFEFKWPSLKLPHFKFTGSWNPFDWPEQFPSIGIDWYAKGGILTKPTLFGISPDGRAQVGGEAGDEAVAPIDTLMGYVREAVAEQTGNMTYQLEKLISMLSDYMPQIVSGMDRSIVLDTGAVVGGIAQRMDSKLGDINRMKGRGN